MQFFVQLVSQQLNLLCCMSRGVTPCNVSCNLSRNLYPGDEIKIEGVFLLADSTKLVFWGGHAPPENFRFCKPHAGAHAWWFQLVWNSPDKLRLDQVLPLSHAKIYYDHTPIPAERIWSPRRRSWAYPPYNTPWTVLDDKLRNLSPYRQCVTLHDQYRQWLRIISDFTVSKYIQVLKMFKFTCEDLSCFVISHKVHLHMGITYLI